MSHILSVTFNVMGKHAIISNCLFLKHRDENRKQMKFRMLYILKFIVDLDFSKNSGYFLYSRLFFIKIQVKITSP